MEKVTPKLSLVRQKVWYRDGGRCNHIERGTGKRCESRRELRIEWVYAFGKLALESRNLRLRCKEHSTAASAAAVQPQDIELTAD